jgi:hypoxanthine phosphoribosyltransferase
MHRVQIKDKTFVLKFAQDDIQKRISDLAKQIDHDYNGLKPLFIIVLNGAFMFASDLIKNINIECELTFVKLSSYQGMQTSGQVKEIIGLQHNIAGREIVVVEDIVDTGITMENLLTDLNKLGPKSIRIASLLFKPESFQKKFPIHYIGYSIPNDFVVGYGLDYDELGRNLPEIYELTHT